MDLNYSPEEEAFRDEVRTWLRENLPDDLRDRVVNYQELSKADLLRWHQILAKKGWVAPDWPIEWAALHLRGRVRRRWLPSPHVVRPTDVCTGVAPLRNAGAEAAFSAAHLPRRGFLVPGLLGAGLRVGPRLAPDPGRARWRRLLGDGAEDLDDPGPLCRLDLLPGAY